MSIIVKTRNGLNKNDPSYRPMHLGNEFLEGDFIYPFFRIVGLNKKCIHILGCLLDSNNNISTVYETVLGHIDMNLRKMVEMNDPFFNSIKNLKHHHDNYGNLPFDLRLAVKESV